jgi:hypothetical protein
MRNEDMNTLDNAHTNQQPQGLEPKVQAEILQGLLDLACDRAFEQYNRTKKINSCLFLPGRNGRFKRHPLKNAGGLLGFMATLDNAAAKINADGDRLGYGIVYFVQQGAEGVCLWGQIDSQQVLSLLRLDRDTGLAVADFSLVKKITLIDGIDRQNLYPRQPSHWRGAECICTIEPPSSAECNAPAFGA